MNYIYGTGCPVRPQCRGPEAGRAGDATRGRLAGRHPERRWRLGRGRRQLQAGIPRLRARAEHGVADRVGADGADGGRRRGASGRRARHCLPAGHAAGRTASGPRRTSPPPASRACSTCATTATRASSRCGRWRATATCGAPAAATWHGACKSRRARRVRAGRVRHGLRGAAGGRARCRSRSTASAPRPAGGIGAG